MGGEEGRERRFDRAVFILPSLGYLYYILETKRWTSVVYSLKAGKSWSPKKVPRKVVLLRLWCEAKEITLGREVGC